MPDFSPLVLTIARESRGMAQTTLAKATGITQGALSQFESGLARPGEDVLSRLAGALNYPESLFGVPVRFQQLPVTFFRKKARVGMRDVNAIRARVNLFRLRLEILLRVAEPSGARMALTDIAKEGLSAEAAAQRLRVYWNVPPGPIKDLTSVVERAGIIVVPFDFGTAAVDGLSLYEPNDTLPPLVFLNRLLPPDRERMTLAHELGHIALHHHLLIPPEQKDMEDEGFRFAQEFLTPAREINGHLSSLTMPRLAQLKMHWRVSMRALVKRAHALGRIGDRQARRLYIMLSRDGVKEIVEIAKEEPTVLRGLVRRHLEDLAWNPRDLSRALHQDFSEFQAEFGVTASHNLRLV